MIAYKGFNANIESVMGNGKKECCTFELGKTYKETESKTARNGFHCCENPFECLGYYTFNGINRFFQVEAAGDINEDESERIACTELTLLKELTPMEFAYYGMVYIVEHPMREKWQQHYTTVKVQQDEAQAMSKDSIAFARGKNPKVKGVPGSILGLIVEPEPGTITQVKLFKCQKETWMGLTEQRELQEVEHEKETN